VTVQVFSTEDAFKNLCFFSDVLSDAKELIYIHPEASLYEAIKTLIHNKIHRQGKHSGL
jgi:CBS domain-containing protein